MNRAKRIGAAVLYAMMAYLWIVGLAGCSSVPAQREPTPEKPCFACVISCKEGGSPSARQHLCRAGRWFNDVELIAREPGEQGAPDTYVARDWYRDREGKIQWKRVARYSEHDIEWMRCDDYQRRMQASLGDRAGVGDSALGTPPPGWQP